MSEPPPYLHYINMPRPDLNWDTPVGSWVGIWDYEWGNLLGNSILAHSPMYEFEVWQPDPRADRIYEHRFENGLRHKLFPAEIRQQFDLSVITSNVINNHLRQEEKKQDIILQAPVSANSGWLILPNRHLRIMGTLHGIIHFPIHQFFKLRKNLFRYYFLLREQKALKKIINHYDLITYQNDYNLEDLKSIYRGPLRKITMGVDFKKFIPLDQDKCRRELDLPIEKKIFLTVGRITRSKQNEKVIRVFNKLQDRHDFLLIMAGNPHNLQYFAYLKKIATPLLSSGKILFPGYLRGKTLVQYYNAADLFLMTSEFEGGPVASMEAIACGTRVFSTRTGYIAELLMKYHAGYVTGRQDYWEWEKIFSQYLDGKLEIPILDRQLALENFSWPAIASKFDAAYQQMISDKRQS